MSKFSMSFMTPAALPKPTVVTADDGRAEKVTTGKAEKSIELFAGIHRSKRFTIAAAHTAFAGLKRTK